MQPRKVDVMFATFSYGGNGGISSQVPDVGRWLLETSHKAKADERVDRIGFIEIADTPITFSRNRAVLQARARKADFLVMLDSDMMPDMYLGASDVEPFWDVAFDFAYRHYDRGPVAVAAPYCGPPPHENVYVFRWANMQSDHPNDMDVQLQQYTRNEAFHMAGIQPVAALPTGLILFDLRIFDLTEPKKPGDNPWFYYETDLYQSQKRSTEDVTATRDMSLAGVVALGYNPIFCAWSSWAGHWKPKCVGKPNLITPDIVAPTLARAATGRLPSDRKLMEVHAPIADEIDWASAVVLDSPAEPETTGCCDGNGEQRSCRCR